MAYQPGFIRLNRLPRQTHIRLLSLPLYGETQMASTTFSGPVTSTNGFIGSFTGGTTNLALTGTLEVDLTSTLTGVVTAPAGVIADVTGNVSGSSGSCTGNAATATLAVTATTSLVTPQSTVAAISAIANAINTTGKVVGKTIVVLASGVQYTAVGTTAAANWVPSDGTAAISPA